MGELKHLVGEIARIGAAMNAGAGMSDAEGDSLGEEQRRLLLAAAATPCGSAEDAVAAIKHVIATMEKEICGQEEGEILELVAAYLRSSMGGLAMAAGAIAAVECAPQ